MESEFGTWLDEILVEKRITRNQLAEAAGLGSGSLTNIINGKRGIGPDVCRSIAQILHVPEELVFRKAGLLSPKPDQDILLERSNFLISQLPLEQREQALAMLEFMYEQTEKKKSDDKKNHLAGNTSL